MSVTAALGFVGAGVHCGIKPSGDLDLSLVATADSRPVPAAAVFTANKMTAAPVLTSDAHLTGTGGRAAAVILNSGNANAATGSTGRADAEAMCAAAADALGCGADEVLVCSTGLIGIPLPIDTILAGVPALVAARTAGDGGGAAAEAIRTTDTFAKQAVAAVGTSGAVVGGMAKGAAMLAPNMATMLAVVTTDAEVDHATLRRMLRRSVAGSFNVLMTDACQSTNDTVIVLASGAAGPVADDELQAALDEVCGSLARQMCEDAEGATKVVELTVSGAASAADAEAAARRIAASALCKCSWFGRDPYWVVSRPRPVRSTSRSIRAWSRRRTGASGSPTAGSRSSTTRTAVREHMAQRHLVIGLDLGLGDGSFTVLTNDLTHDYVDENTGGS